MGYYVMPGETQFDDPAIKIYVGDWENIKEYKDDDIHAPGIAKNFHGIILDEGVWIKPIFIENKDGENVPVMKVVPRQPDTHKVDGSRETMWGHGEVFRFWAEERDVKNAKTTKGKRKE